MFKNFGAPHVAAAFAFVAAIAGWQFYSQSETAEDTSSGSVPVVTAEETASAVKVEATEADEDNAEADVAQASSEAEEESATTTETEGTDTGVEVAESDATDETQAAETQAAETHVDEAHATETEVEESATEEVAEADTAETQEASLPIPTFDVVRVETDGTTVVAGTCPAGSLVTIQVDGQDVESGTCDATGQFVLFLNIGDSDQARVMTLSAKQFDTTLLADAQVIIAPVKTQVAETETEESTEAEETVASQDDVTDEVSPESDEVLEETVEVAVAEDAPKADEALTVTEEVVQEAAEETVDQAAVTEVNEQVSTDEKTQPVAESTEPASDQNEVVEVSEDAVEEEITSADQSENAMDSSETETVAPETQTAPAVLLVKDDGVDILQGVGAAPQVMDQLTIAAISYSEEGAVYLSGFSPAGFLRVYLNNTQVIVLEVPEPGEWKAELVDVAPGVYTLRVDQVDAGGNVQSRVETPFKREEPAKVAQVAQTRKPLVSLEVVQPGSTLWAISRETYGSGILFVNIFEANRDQIRDPDLIYPGQIFELPAPPGAQKKKRGSGQ